MGKQEQKGEADAEEIERYRKLQQVGHHTLPYKESLRARELGIELPEADPVYDIPKSKEECMSVVMPEGFPLGKCYRLTEELGEQNEAQIENACLLSALGRLNEPFVPVWIAEEYDGYRWAKLPTVESVEVTTEGIGKAASLSGWRWLLCYDDVVITAHTSDGKTHSASVCLALDAPVLSCTGGTQTIPVTLEARTRIPIGTLLRHLGVFGEDPQYVAKLNDFWLRCSSDEEALRLATLERLEFLVPDWRSITRPKDGVVAISNRWGEEMTLRPKPASADRAASQE